MLLRPDVIMLGDFNVDLLPSTEFSGKIQCSFGLEQLIKTPIHTTAKSKTLLDHTYSSENLAIFPGIVELHIADHQAIYCALSKIDQNGARATCHLINQFK